MNYEKAYKEALERAKLGIKECGDNKGRISMIESIFPELKESEDERIRKELIAFIKKRDRSGCDYDYDKWISWLEKQKSVSEIVERCKNSWYNEGKIAGQFEGITDDEKYQQGWHDALEKQCKESSWKPSKEQINALEHFVRSIGESGYASPYDNNLNRIKSLLNDLCKLEKQGEQKANDKSEPKFHEGDWIINDQGSAFQIAYIDTENCRYVFEVGGYTKEEMNYENIAFANNHYREWTIDDAKDGDVLVSKDNQPFIYNGKYDTFCVGAYCGMNCVGDSFILAKEKCNWTGRKGVKPASKEQREQLFQKIEEAGYQWDAEKKELKLLISNGGDFESNNSKQKPVNDTVETIVEAISNTSILDMIEDKDAFTNPSAFENSLGRLLKLFEKLPKQDLLDGLKFYTNVVEHDGEYIKPAECSEEDERIRKALIELFTATKKKDWRDIPTEKIIAWLEKQGDSSAKWQDNTPDNKPAINHSVLMKTTQGIAEGYFAGNLWFQFRWSSNIKDSDVLAWMELSDLDEQSEQKETLCDKCRKAQPSQSCQDITALGRCALEHEQGEQKHTWHDSDERIRITLHSFINDINGDLLHQYLLTKDEVMIWLEKQGNNNNQNWKPSKEQINALEHFVRSIGESGYASPYDNNLNRIKSLLNDLCKLEKQGEKKRANNIEDIVEIFVHDEKAYTNPAAFENSLGRLLKLFEKVPKKDILDGLKFYTNVVEHDGEYVKPAELGEEDEQIILSIEQVMNCASLLNIVPEKIDKIKSWLKSLKERLS